MNCVMKNWYSLIRHRLHKIKNIEENDINEVINLVKQNDLLSDAISDEGSLRSDLERRKEKKWKGNYISNKIFLILNPWNTF